MNRTILAVALAAITGVAGAAQYNDNTAVSGSASQSQSASGAIANTGASNSANSQNINFNAPGTLRYKGGYDVRNTPDTSVFIPASSAPCVVSAGVSGSGAGFGFALGGNYEDKGCTAREDARTLAALGMIDQAVLRLCQREEMAKALGPKCGVTPAPLPAVTTPKGVTTVSVYGNPATVKELNGFNH